MVDQLVDGCFMRLAATPTIMTVSTVCSTILKYFSSESYLKKSIVVSEALTCLLTGNFALLVFLFVWIRRKSQSETNTSRPGPLDLQRPAEESGKFRNQ